MKAITEKLICAHETVGIDIEYLSDKDCAYLLNIYQGTYFSRIKGFKRKFRGYYLIQVRNILVFTTYGAIEYLETVRDISILD